MVVSPEYLAGILDGEGCIGIARSKGSLTITIAVSMTDRRVPELLLARYGGRLNRISRGERHKDAFVWRVEARIAERCLRELRPFLIVKAQQADLALSLRDHLKLHGPLPRGPYADPTSARFISITAFRESAKERMHVLNKRGVS